MKKITFLILTIAFCILNYTFVKAQRQQINNKIPGNSHEYLDAKIMESYKGKTNLPKSHKNAKLSETKTLMWTWDTIICYDTIGGLSYKYTQIYNANGTVLNRLVEKYQTGNWIDEMRFSFTWDLNDNCTSLLWELSNGSIWVNYRKSIYTYNNEGKEITYTQQLWQSNAWENQSLDTYTYDINGNMITDLNQIWQGGVWINDDRDTYTYDINGNMLTDLWESFNSSSWENVEKYTYTYDSNGNMLTYLSEFWGNNTWTNQDKDTYTYDINGNMLTDLHEEYLNGTWTNKDKYSTTYDSNENILTKIYEEWQNSAWVKNYKQSYIYDTNGNSINGSYDTWQNGNWHADISSILKVYSQKYTVGNFILTQFHTYTAHFFSYTSGINKVVLNNSDLKIYPNPAKDIITVEKTAFSNDETISIYNIHGQLIMQQTLQSESANINISGLIKGIYVLKMDNSENTEITRFVKE